MSVSGAPLDADLNTHDTLVSATFPVISTFPCSVAQPPVRSSPFWAKVQVMSLALPEMSLWTFHSPLSGSAMARPVEALTATAPATRTVAMSAFTGGPFDETAELMM